MLLVVVERCYKLNNLSEQSQQDLLWKVKS